MADSDKEFKISIVTTADTAPIDEYVRSLGKAVEAAKENTASELESKAAATGSSGAHWELRRAFEELSRIMPGLGPLAGLAGEGFRDMADSEVGAAAAADTLITTMGPVAIVILSIQAAVEYWDLYQEKVKEVAAKNTEAMRQLQTDTEDAFKSWQKFQDALNGGDQSAAKPFSDELESRKAIMEARNKQEMDELHARAQVATEQASTPEQKAAVKEFWDKAEQRLKEAQAEELRGIVSGVVSDIQTAINVAAIQANGDRAQSNAAYQNMLKTGDQTGYKQIQADLNEQTKAVHELTALLNQLQSQAQRDKQIAGIDAAGLAKVQQIQGQGDFETGIRAAMGDFGPKLTDKQAAAMQMAATMFQALGGSMDTWVKYMEQYHQTLQQKLNAIDQQYARMQSQIAATPQQFR